MNEKETRNTASELLLQDLQKLQILNNPWF